MHSASLMDKVGRGLAKGKILKLREMYGERLYTLHRPRKHRYFYFLGTRKQKQEMRDSLTYTVAPYPKGDNGRYDTYDNINRQGILF